jgi:small subunit ribosomal protein S6
MPLYESTFVARQDLSRQDVTKLTEQYTTIIESGGGKIVKNEYWGLRSLAYRIRKARKGHYTMLGIDAPFEAMKEMQRTMGITEEIIRTMTIRVDELDANPSVMMMQRSSREDVVEEAAVVAEVETPAEEKI